MPDNHQGRTDPMPDGKRKYPVMISIVLLVIIAAIFAVFVFV
ncbi:hypothetical protein [Robiginitomaculum antarcticum]|nr:hypothetical protein [Robiginitomaculum antarcticum]